MVRLSRMFGVLPSQLLTEDYGAFEIDMVMGAAEIRRIHAEVAQNTRKGSDEWIAIRDAARAAIRAEG